MRPVRALEPHRRSDKGGSQAGGQRHVGSRESCVRKHGGQQAEDQQAEEGHQSVEIPPTRLVNDNAGNPEERQDPGARPGEGLVVMVAVIEDACALMEHRIGAGSLRLGADAQQARTEGSRHTG